VKKFWNRKLFIDVFLYSIDVIYSKVILEIIRMIFKFND